MTRVRLVAWNIRHGGSNHAALATALLAHDPDVIVLGNTLSGKRRAVPSLIGCPGPAFGVASAVGPATICQSPAIRTKMHMDDSSELYQRARERMSAKDYAAAAQRLEKSAELQPHFKTRELLGECRVHLGLLREAVIPLAAATALNEQARAPSLLAVVLSQLGELKRPLEWLAWRLLEARPIEQLSTCSGSWNMRLSNEWLTSLAADERRHTRADGGRYGQRLGYFK